MPTTVARPEVDEYPEFFKGYISHVSHAPDLIAALEAQRDTIAAWGRMPPERASYRYAEGKWTAKEVIGHIIDAERIFCYRLLRIGRDDQTPLPAFDENKYAAVSNAGERAAADLAREMSLVRESSIALVRSLDERALACRGVVRAGEISARAQAFVIAGHFAHHATILRERYGV